MVFHVLKPFSDLTKKEKVTIAKGFNKIGIYNGLCLISNRTYYFVVNAAIKLIALKRRSIFQRQTNKIHRIVDLFPVSYRIK